MSQQPLNLRELFPTVSYDEWRRTVESDLKGASFEKKLVTKTHEGLDLQPIASESDLPDALASYPGFAPYIRGGDPDGHRTEPWLIAQTIPAATAAAFNAALRYDLERGQTGILLDADTATAKGCDPDTAVTGDVGTNGVSIATLDELSEALDGISCGTVPVRIRAGYDAMPLLTLFVSYLEKHNANLAALQAGVEADPCASWAAWGTLPVPPEQAFDALAHSVQWTGAHAPRFTTIGIDTTVYHRAGASAVQELAISLATAVQYMNKLSERGCSIQEISRAMHFSFGVGPFFFMEIAKFRAIRLLWSRVAEAWGLGGPEARIRIHASSGSFNQTTCDPYVNMLRTTTEAFAAVVGGVDSLTTQPFDAVFRTPDEFSRRIARNTQIILSEESHMARVIDPAGGSYYVERLTRDLAAAAWSLFQEIEKRGGIVKGLEEGYIQSLIGATAAERAKDYAKRKTTLVGVNKVANLKEQPLPPNSSSEDDRARITAKARQHRASRNETAVRAKLASAAQFPTNDHDRKFAAACDAAAAGATIGELAQAWHPQAQPSGRITPIAPFRPAGMFERLRTAAATYAATHGTRPKVFCATMGSLAQYKARADFARGFFEVGGFEVKIPAGFATPEEAADAAAASGAPIIVICSTDETYPALVPPFTAALRAKRPECIIVLAGYPKEIVETMKQAGVHEFIYLGADVPKILSGLLAKIGGPVQ